MADILQKSEEDMLCTIQQALEERFSLSDRRLKHVISVADTAEMLAAHYEYDCYKARIAGLLHDWDKLLPLEELKASVERYQIEYVGELSDISPLLHAWTAAYSLRESFPNLDEEIYQAVFNHTIGTARPSTLDMIVFVADCLEPTRNPAFFPELTALIGKVSLECLYIQCLKQGIIFLLLRGKKVYPPALEYYNELVRRYPRESGDLGLVSMGKKKDSKVKTKGKDRSEQLLKELKKEYRKACLKKLAKKEGLSKEQRSKACKICKGC